MVDDNKKPNTDKPSSSKDKIRTTRSTTGSLPKNSRNRSVIDNLVQGQPSRSRNSQTNVQDVPDPVPPPDSKVTSTLEEVEIIQQVCEQENESIRQQVKKVSDQVDAIAKKSPSTGFDPDALVNALRAEFDDKIGKLINAQPDVSKLIDELFTLRRDTNTLLESQSQARKDIDTQDAQPDSADEHGNSATEDETDVLDQLPSRIAHRQHQAQASDSRRSKRNNKKTTTLSYHSRRYDSPSDTDSDRSTETVDQYHRQEETTGVGERNTIPFFRRKKGAHHHGLTVIQPSDPIYDRLMNYRYYRLADTRESRSTDTMKKVREHIRSLSTTFDDKDKFSGSDPILVLEFLTKFVEEADTLCITEAQAFIILPKLMVDPAQKQFRSVKSGARSGGVTCWPEAVQHLLRTYATPATIRRAVYDLRDIRQQPRENENEYSARLNRAAHRCGNVYDEVEKMTIFVNGLLPCIQTDVARHRESRNRRDLSYEELVQFARDEGDSYRARHANLRVVRTVSKPSGERAVHFMEPSSSSGSRMADGDELMIVEEGSIPTDYLPSTADTAESEELLYTGGRQRRNNNTEMVRPNRIGFEDRNTVINRPGWERRKQIICHQCYEIDDHISPNCTVKLGDMRRVVENYDKLSVDQKESVPDNSYKLAHRYLEMKSDLSSNNRRNGDDNPTDQKN